MELLQEGFSCEYEMNVFINIFFDKNEDVRVNTFFSYENEKINTSAEIEYNGKIFKGKLSYDYRKESQWWDKIVFRCFVVRAFINTAKQINDVNVPWGALSGIRPAKVVRQIREKGCTKEETRIVLSEIFGVSSEKIDLAMTVADKEAVILKDIKENSASLYIGIPFCPTRCLYCSFVSNDLRTGKKYVDEYTRLLTLEIKKISEVIKELGFYIENIYIGGGTPTSIDCENLEKILKATTEYTDMSRIKEFTLEAGRADTIDREKLLTAKKYGVDRISINPQTMNEETLKRVGRNHTPQMVKDAFFIAREAGFSNINMDLIAGLPSEDAEDFKKSLEEVIALDPENITVHSLCIKRAAALRFSQFGLGNPVQMEEMLHYTQKRMKETGRIPYYMYRQKNISGNLENVGYAKEGFHSFYNVNIMEEVQNIIAAGGGGTCKIVKGDRIDRIFNFKDACEYIKRFDEIIAKKDEFLKIYNEM